MRKDTSPRTKSVRKYDIAFKCACIVMLLSAVWLASGFLNYGTMVQKSSSPIGTEMTFARSSATVSIAGIYTDEVQSVLIVRLTSDDTSRLRLPYKGSDYRVYIASDSMNGYAGEDIPVLFGRYSTDGDLFLILPKPTDSVYNVFVMNTNFVATDDLATNLGEQNGTGTSATSTPSTSGTDGNGEEMSDEQVQSIIAQSLNTYEYTDVNERSNNIEIPSNQLDIIGFRVTLDPAFDTDEYRARVIPGQLLSDDGQFDFEEFFNQVFKGAATDTIEDEYTQLNNQKDLYEQRIAELEERLDENPNDTSASTLLDQVRDDLSQIESQLDQLAESYDETEGVQYRDSMFRNMQTEARVISTDQASTLSTGEATQ